MTMHDESLRPEDFADAAAAAIADALGRGPREAVHVLAQAGLTGVCTPEEDGGMGLGIAFAVPIAYAAGKLRLPFPLVEQLLLARALSGSPEGDQLVSGDKIATIAWAGSLAQGMAGTARHASVSDWVLVPDADGAALVDLAGLVIQSDTALDPEFPQQWVQLSGATVLARLDAAVTSALMHDARILLASLVNGAADGALEASALYMANRVQFGRPLSAKQAVRHWLARMKLVQEVSAAAIQRALATNEYGQARAAHAALAGAITHAIFVLEKAIHLHGGMGFTWEVPLHYSLREVRKLDAAFGGGSLARDLGRTFIEVA